MRLSGLGWRRTKRATAFVTLVMMGLIASAETVHAAGGSWGGSFGGSSGGSSGGGSWGGSSGGSSGGGLFAGRRPLRNLLGRIGSRFAQGSSGGSSGGYSGYSGSSGGYSGSSGGYVGDGSSGGSLGSLDYSSSLGYGSSGSAIGYESYGSGYGSSGSYLGVATVDSYPTSFSSAPVETSYVAPLYDGAVINGGMINGSTSYPMDGTIIDSGVYNVAPAENYFQGESTGSIIQDGTSTDTGNSNQPVPPPGPSSDDSTSNEQPLDHVAVLRLKLPADAKVYVNDKLTRTEGELRSYVSKNLKPAHDYQYEVKAVVERDGKEVVRTQTVNLQTGVVKTVEFDFNVAPVTALTLQVPDDAVVKLCGNATKAKGVTRHYATDKLEPGQTWKDYTVEVTTTRNGQAVTQQKTLELVGGQTYSLQFDFDGTSERVAVR